MASKCIDGIMTDQSNLCHSKGNKNSPWFALEFPEPVKVSRVDIYNKGSPQTISERLKNVEVRLTEDLPTSDEEMFTGGQLLGTLSTTTGGLIKVEGPERTGRYVLIQMNNPKNLALHEVVAFGRFVSTMTTPPPTTTTSFHNEMLQRDCIESSDDSQIENVTNPSNLPDIDIFLNPHKASEVKHIMDEMMNTSREYFNGANMALLYPELFRILWHYTLPCFSKPGVEHAMLRSCSIGRIVGKKRDLGILDPTIFFGQNKEIY